MCRKFALFLCLLLLVAAPVRAGSQPHEAVIRNALALPAPRIDGYRLETKGLNAFYGLRDYRPAWNFAGDKNKAIFTAFLDSINQLVAWHGLIEEKYATGLMRQLAAADTEDSRLKLELVVTDTLLRLANDLHGDGVNLAQLYPGWNFQRMAVDIPALLAGAVAASSINEFFEGLSPKHPAYRDLAGALRFYRDMAAKAPWTQIQDGPMLRVGDKGQRVSQLRARLAAEGYILDTSSPKSAVFDTPLRLALQTYQSRNGLQSDGIAGGITLAALNVPIATRIDQIQANMERWRHMPDTYPPSRGVVINIADASIEITRDGRPIYRGIVIVGQVERKTPFIQSAVRSLIINPPWHVPAKIARADILPRLREDPHYLEKQGITIRDSEGDPYGSGIDWKSLPDEEFNFRLRQQPGKLNSLGRLKFDFDNSFAVYMHGTPHQELFEKYERALSSGCIRLRDPELVAEILLADTGAWSIERIEAAIAKRKTRWIPFRNPVPIDIVYWTAFTDEMGHIQFRGDVYDYDRFLIENLRPAAAAPAESADMGATL
ncbi:MAG: murein L,D-transpeptidase [Bdellovibrionales bacterium]